MAEKKATNGDEAKTANVGGSAVVGAGMVSSGSVAAGEEGPPAGFTEVSIDINGWFKPFQGAIIYGQIVECYAAASVEEGSLRDVMKIKLSLPLKALDVDDTDKEIMLEKGQIVGVTVTAKLSPALEYVEKRGYVWAQCLGEQKLDRGKKMWMFKVACKGEKSPYRRPVVTTATSNQDIPF